MASNDQHRGDKELTPILPMYAVMLVTRCGVDDAVPGDGNVGIFYQNKLNISRVTKHTNHRSQVFP